MAILRQSVILDPALECQSAEARYSYLERRLAATVQQAYARAPGVRHAMQNAKVGPDDIGTLADLQRLPVTRKDDLAALQAASLPFGGLNALPVSSLQRVFMSPGNIYDPQGPGGDFWRFRPALTAAGFRAGDLVQNTFSYHLTPAGFMFDGALRSLGCVVIPAGTGQTELQVRVAGDLGVTGYVGTPSFLYTLLGKARESGAALRIEVAFVSAEMLPESLRSELENDFSIRVLQGYGTADLGLLAYECPEKNGMHLHPEAIVELLDRETGVAALPGEPGEIIATVFDEAYPLLRFATGDLSSFAADSPCPCGRTAPRLTGLLGRVGDAVKVKGMFIRGSQIDAVIERFPRVARYRAIVSREQHQDWLQFEVELASPEPDAASFCARLTEALRQELKVRGEVQIVAAGTIAQGARKIDDRRVWR
jgi:phenylacetate-CoA ligase